MKIQIQVMIMLAAIGFSFSMKTPICSAFQANESASASDAVQENDNEESKQDDSSGQTRKPTRFLRLLADEYDSPVALQTATAKYVLEDDQGEIELEVFLESVIHVADASYYRSFQKRFDRYDRVLYEQVLQQKQRETDQENAPGGIEILQQLSTGTLGLAYQFDEIDYDANNMLHADLTAEQITERMVGRGDDKATLLADLLTHFIKKINTREKGEPEKLKEDSDAGASPKKFKFDISVFTDPDGIMKIRRMMAIALVDSRLLDSSLPSSLHKLIVGDRNDRAMTLLFQESKTQNKRIAIFYGIGHMADFEKRLIDEYGMKRVDVNWRNAWDLRDGAIEGAPLEGLIESTFRDSFKNKLRDFAKGITDKKADKKENQNTTGQTDIENTKKIDAMEQALKALEAKLMELENRQQVDPAETDKSNDKNIDDKID